MESLKDAAVAFSASRDVYLSSYADFLDKLLRLLGIALEKSMPPTAKEDVKRVSDEMQQLRDQLKRAPFASEAAEATAAAADSATTTTTTESSAGVEDSSRDAKPSKEFEMRSDTKGTSTTATATTTTASAENEVRAEVESQASRVTTSESEGPLLLDEDPDTVRSIASAFYAFRYHKAEFRRIFQLPQGDQPPHGNNNNNSSNNSNSSSNNNNNSSSSSSSSNNNNNSSNNSNSSNNNNNNSSSSSSSNPTWLLQLAAAAVEFVDAGALNATAQADVKSRLPTWRRLAAESGRGGGFAAEEAAGLFRSIPALAGLPRAVGREAEAMLRVIDSCCCRMEATAL